MRSMPQRSTTAAITVALVLGVLPGDPAFAEEGNATRVTCSSTAEPAQDRSGDELNPHKVRVLLRMALTKTKDPREVQRMLEQY